MPVTIDFVLRRRPLLWEQGDDASLSVDVLIPGERTLRGFKLGDFTYTVTNARLVRAGGAGLESAWWCRIRKVELPEPNRGSGSGIKPSGAIVFPDHRFVIAADSPGALGVLQGLLRLAEWCRMQHELRGDELGEVGLVHRADCPYMLEP